MSTRFHTLRYSAVLGLAGLATQLALGAAGNPLPRCSATAQCFYLARFNDPGVNTYPTTALDLVTLGTSPAVTVNTVWSGQGAPLPPPEDAAAAGRTAGATVAMGMNPKNGYIYAIRAASGDPAWPGPWQTSTMHFQVFKYGASGVDNLGTIVGLPDGSGGLPDLRAQLGPNYNAADFDPATGYLIIASFQTGGSLSRLIRIDVSGDVPKFVDTVTLKTPIPGAQSGDFAIDATGTYAYGIAKGPNQFSTSTSYRITLSDGTVTNLPSVFTGVDTLTPYGAGATLNNGNMAFYTNGGSVFPPAFRVMTPGGIISGAYTFSATTYPAISSDGASALIKLQAQLACTPTTLVDAANNVSTCTITLDQAAPVGGLQIALTPPASNPRYSTTCASPMTVTAGQTTAQCTVTATPNTIPGDGDVTAIVSLATPDPLADYELGALTSSSILVQNDDQPVVYVPPVVTIACTPTSLVDSAGQASVCTVSSDAPAPAGGLVVGLTPPAANARYSTTCGASLVITEGASSSTCTITATPNTVSGDGSVTANIAVQANATLYQLGTPSGAAVVVNDDDSSVPPVVNPPNSGSVPVPLGGLPAGLGIMAIAWGLLRRRQNRRNGEE